MSFALNAQRMAYAAAGVALALSSLSANAAVWSRQGVLNASGTAAQQAAGSTLSTGSGCFMDLTPDCKLYASNNGSTTTANVSAWANTGTGGKWQAAYLSDQGRSGFGVKNTATAADDANEGVAPEHAIDNEQRTDAVLFSFSAKTALNSVITGWSQTDQDITLLRYVGTGSAASSLASFKLTNGTAPSTNMLVANGWALVGNYAYGSSGSGSTMNVNASGLSSSGWLVMAYNTAFGSTVAGRSSAGQSLSQGNDFFKLLAVTGKAVPEPGSLALAGLGLFGIFAARRAKQRRSA